MESRDALKGARPVRRGVAGVQHIMVVRWSLTLQNYHLPEVEENAESVTEADQKEAAVQLAST